MDAKLQTLHRLASIREAAKLQFPTADIRTMLAEIERGYLLNEE